uniref:Uncharacterized protein n=1 Tax=Rhizophora mucronata TaxID=61149 RepID=A0A2P2PLK7_RHIMU
MGTRRKSNHIKILVSLFFLLCVALLSISLLANYFGMCHCANVA